ncbi:ExbD/TolR family protein [Bdellovibrio sp. HCB274]|uniref:ExbD/TolR family protein n=1 Tax=Bdellovibrio sp. HCB274 TaxID=3394361 RepID=UPI0039B3EE2D
MRTSFLNANQKRSPLVETQTLKAGARKKSGAARNLALALPLTSLIDAFSIIVIYLLIGTQSTGIEVKSGPINLPTADHATSVDKEMAILRIEKGNYFINDERVAGSQLGSKLESLKKDPKDSVELMIQADTEMKYADLDPIIKAGSLAGIEKLKFAVVPKQ